MKGLRYLGPVTLSGQWLPTDRPEVSCCRCGGPIGEGDGQPLPMLEYAGRTLGALCDVCAMAVIELAIAGKELE